MFIQIFQVYGVFDDIQKKWVHGIHSNKFGSDEIYLLHYRKFIKISNSSLLVEYELLKITIFWGTLALSPCKASRNPHTMVKFANPTQYWTEEGIIFFKKLIDNENKTLCLKFELESSQSKFIENEINTGNIIIIPNLNNALVNVEQKMIDSHHAILRNDKEITSAKLPMLLTSTHVEIKKTNIPLKKNSCLLVNSRYALPPKDLFVYGLRQKSPINSCKFNQQIRESLNNLSFQQIKNIFQAHCWSQIYYDRSVVIVTDNKQCVKRDTCLNYLPPIIHKIQAERTTKQKNIGPSAIILTNLRQNVLEIEKTCSSLAPKNSEISSFLKIVCASNGDQRKINIKSIVNDCDILITTPPEFARILSTSQSRKIHKTQLKYIVFDDVSNKREIKFIEEIKFILSSCVGNNYDNLVVCFVMNDWANDFMQITRKIIPKNMVVCIENFFEATCYVGLKIEIKEITSLKNKLRTIIADLISLSYQQIKTVIVVDYENEKYIHLLKKEISLSKHKINENDVFFTTDETLESVGIHDIKHIIHFDWPESWEKFTERFSVILNYLYENVNIQQTTTTQSPVATIYLEKENYTAITQLASSSAFFYLNKSQAQPENDFIVRNMMVRI